MYDTYRHAARTQTIGKTALYIACGLVAVAFIATTPMDVTGHWGAPFAILAVVGFSTLLSMPGNWVGARYALAKPSWFPLTWRPERRWYAPHSPVVVDGERRVALDWTDEGAYGSRTWVLVLSWPISEEVGASVEWRPLEDLTPWKRPAALEDAA